MADPVSKTVKGMDAEVWEKGVEAAKRRGQPFAEWLARAITDRLGVVAGDQVIFPDERPQPEPSLPQSAPPVGPAFALSEIEAAMRTATVLADAAGLEVPKPMARHYFALLTGTLRLARGLPPLKARQTQRRIGQTRPENGQTIEGGGE